MNHIVRNSNALNEQVSLNAGMSDAGKAEASKSMLDAMAIRSGLSEKRKPQFVSFMLERYKPGSFNSQLAYEWACRFRSREEWDFADDDSKKVLEKLYPELYKIKENKEQDPLEYKEEPFTEEEPFEEEKVFPSEEEEGEEMQNLRRKLGQRNGELPECKVEERYWLKRIELAWYEKYQEMYDEKLDKPETIETLKQLLRASLSKFMDSISPYEEEMRDEIEDIIGEIDTIGDVEDFNNVMEQLYDFGDLNDVWIDISENKQLKENVTDMEDMRKRIMELSQSDGVLLSDIHKNYISTDVPGELDETKQNVQDFLAEATEEQLKEIWSKFVHYGSEFDENKSCGQRRNSRKSGKKNERKSIGKMNEKISIDLTRLEEIKDELKDLTDEADNILRSVGKGLTYTRARSYWLGHIRGALEKEKGSISSMVTMQDTIDELREEMELEDVGMTEDLNTAEDSAAFGGLDSMRTDPNESKVNEQDEPSKITKKKPWEKEPEVKMSEEPSPEETPVDDEGIPPEEGEETPPENEEGMEGEVPPEEEVPPPPEPGIKTGAEELNHEPAAAKEPEEVRVEKEYIGSKGDDFFYITQATSDTGEPNDLIIQNAVGEEVFSAVKHDLDPTDVPGFILSAIKEVDMDEIATELVDRYIVPSIEKRSEEETEEEIAQEEEPFEMGAEELGAPKKKYEGLVDYEGKTYSYSIVEHDDKCMLCLGGRDFSFDKDTISLYESDGEVKDICLDILKLLESKEISNLKLFERQE